MFCMSHDLAIEEMLELRSIRPAAIQVRTCNYSFDRQAIKELADSICQHGLIQPITVRPVDSGFEIVAGHRRYQACKLLRWRVIPARIRALSDKDAFEIQLIENMHRMTMDPVEEAEAFKAYILDYGWGGVSQLARIISKSEQYVSSRIQLLRLPKEIMEEVAQKKLKPSHALELLNIEQDKQKLIAEEIINGDLSVHDLREIRRKIKNGARIEQIFGFNGMWQDSIVGQKRRDDISSSYSSKSEEIKLLSRTLLVLRTSLSRLDVIIEEANGKLRSEERTEVVGELMQFRLRIHSMIDDDLKKIAILKKRQA
ncbi:MAG: ParB/RepB/Spo0J family partition protein [Thermoproteota archaeon]|nr:ParB/RepB/Spo0J family partition protein [Thermoproteota archaeon]